MKSIPEIIEACRGQDIGLDIETVGPRKQDGLDPLKGSIHGVAISLGVDKGWYISVGTAEFPYLETLKELSQILHVVNRVVMHNAKFDMEFLTVAGWDFWPVKVACTMIAAQLLDENRQQYNLDIVSKEYLGRGKLTKYSQLGGFLSPPIEEYGYRDAELCLELWKIFEPKLENEGLTRVFDNIEMEVIKCVVEMELRGLDLDMDHLYFLRKKYKEELKEVTQNIWDEAGCRFNPNSQDDVIRVLFGHLKLSTRGIRKSEKTGKYSVDKVQLAKLKDLHPIIPMLIRRNSIMRTLNTEIDGYIERSDEQGRIHANIKQNEAVTGRMSAADPNLTNMSKWDPDGLRRAVTSREGYVILQADYSQIELVFMAYRSGDPNMLRIYNTPGSDIHQETFEACGCKTRTQAKGINFGVIYGIGNARLAQSIGCSEEEAAEFKRLFFIKFPLVKAYMNEIDRLCRTKGWVKSVTGRRRRFPHYDGTQRGWWNQAVNFPVQGGCADLIKIALRNYYRSIREKRRELSGSAWNNLSVISIVHDELLAKCPKSIAHEAYKLMIYEMENAMKLPTVPIRAEGCIVRNWGEAKLEMNAATGVHERLRRYVEDGMSESEIHFMFPEQKDFVDEQLRRIGAAQGM